MTSAELAEQPAAKGKISKTALANIARRHQRLAEAKAVVLDLIQAAPPTEGPTVDLRRAAFEQRGIPSEYSGAALQELERDGVIEMAPDFSYRLASSDQDHPSSHGIHRQGGGTR